MVQSAAEGMLFSHGEQVPFSPASGSYAPSSLIMCTWQAARRLQLLLALRQVVFRAKRGISYMGDVVIDDVAFVHCAPPLPSDRPCTPEQYACANGRCIPQDNLCDFINHCGDDSDEDANICGEALLSWPDGRHIFWLTKKTFSPLSFSGLQRALQLRVRPVFLASVPT